MAYERFLRVRIEYGEPSSDTESTAPGVVEASQDGSSHQSPLEKMIHDADENLEAREMLLTLLEDKSVTITEPSVQAFLQRHGDFILRSRLEALVGRHLRKGRGASRYELHQTIKNDPRVKLFKLTDSQIYRYITKRELATVALS